MWEGRGPEQGLDSCCTEGSCLRRTRTAVATAPQASRFTREQTRGRQGVSGLSPTAIVSGKEGGPSSPLAAAASLVIGVVRDRDQRGQHDHAVRAYTTPRQRSETVSPAAGGRSPF